MEQKIKDVHDEYGFLILNRTKVLIGTFSKEKKEINFQSNIDLKVIKGRRGGCTRMRFARIRTEHNFKIFKFIEENLEKIFTKDNLLNISGLIIAGDINIIKEYLSFKGFNAKFNEYICTIIETEYDGELGFNEAIELSMLNN